MYNIWVNISFIKPKLHLILYLMFFTLFAGANYSYAAQINLDNIPELAPVELMDKDEFSNKTKLVENESDLSKDLAYKINIPSDWKETHAFGEVSVDNLALGEKVLGVVSGYASPPNSEHIRSFISIEALKLTYEIGVKNWFINYVLTNGLSLERLTLKNKRELEAIYVEVKKDTTYIVRAKAIINGSKMIVARYYVSQEMFAKEKIMQAQVIDSFNLSYLNDIPIEELKTFGFLNQSYFDYPPSWSFISPKITSIDRMKATLHRNVVKNKLDGRIDIKLTNKLSVKSRSDVIKEFREEFSIDKYNVGKFIETPDMGYHSDMSFGMSQAYELRSEVINMIDYELWVSVMEGKDYYYLITLITPSRGDEFYIWAKNIETYKLVVKYMRRRNGGKNLFEFIN